MISKFGTTSAPLSSTAGAPCERNSCHSKLDTGSQHGVLLVRFSTLHRFAHLYKKHILPLCCMIRFPVHNSMHIAFLTESESVLPCRRRSPFTPANERSGRAGYQHHFIAYCWPPMAVRYTNVTTMSNEQSWTLIKYCAATFIGFFGDFARTQDGEALCKPGLIGC